MCLGVEVYSSRLRTILDIHIWKLQCLILNLRDGMKLPKEGVNIEGLYI